MRILLIGPPACGKGTISELLSKELGLPIIKTGTILRAISPASIWYEAIQDDVSSGRLAQNDIVGHILSEESSRQIYERGYILDGWLRQLSDVDYFNPGFDVVLFLNISEYTSKQRTLSRRVCTKCGYSYNLISFPPAVEGICDFDGGNLVTREDDREEVFTQRWNDFQSFTLPVIEYFRKMGNLLEIDSSPLPEVVMASIISADYFQAVLSAKGLNTPSH